MIISKTPFRISLFGVGTDLKLYSNGADGYVVAPVDDLVFCLVFSKAVSSCLVSALILTSSSSTVAISQDITP